MAISQPPFQSILVDADDRVQTPWAQWFSQLQPILQSVVASGPTSGRPTQNLFIGYPYFDTTLDQMVYWNGVIWVTYAPSTTGTSILKGNGTGGFNNAIAGIDFAPATSGNAILYGNGAGGFSSVSIGSGVTFAGGVLSATGSGGTVTAVTGTAPIASSGGTTPAISISQAGVSTNGYLSSTDWNTFNNKAPATSGTAILYGNGSGGFSSVAIGSGVTFAGGVLSALGSGGTVTSVSGTGTVNGITLTGTVTSSGSLTLGGTLGGIGNSQLTNSSITINGSTVSLGGSTTVTATATNALTIGTGLSGTSYDGSTAVTIANTGVTSITGTANQVIASASTGAVTLSLPQSINSGATPTFTGTNFTGIPNAGLSNSTITINGTSTSLGGSISVGTVTSVGFTGGLITVATPTTTPAFTVAGTSGGIPYFSSASTWATSAALTANALMIGGGTGVAPATTTTGTGVLTALGTNIGAAGAFVTFNGALGTPSSGTVTNLTGTASININGTVGATTATTGKFTTLEYSSTLTGGTGIVAIGTNQIYKDASGNVMFGTTTAIIANAKVHLYAGNGVGTGSLAFVNSVDSTKKWQVGPDANGNFVVFNNASAGAYIVYGGTTWTPNVSDERLKNKVSDIVNGLDAITKLQPLAFYYKNQAQTGIPNYGFFAQNVGQAIPDAQLISPTVDEKLGEVYTYDPSIINVYMVKALQELNAKFETLTARLTAAGL